jgi:hypothetical protein
MQESVDRKVTLGEQPGIRGRLYQKNDFKVKQGLGTWFK